MKKILIFVIIFILTVSSATASALTGDFSDTANDPCNEAVMMLSRYGIINGYPDDTFKPDSTITRAEMAKIVTIASGYYEYSKNMTSTYVDMQGHWAESYVELADALGIVEGIASGTYEPDNIIKFDEAVTVIVRMLGYTDSSLSGKWPNNYYEKAKELNIFENITNHSEFTTRRDVSIMLYNAFRCDLVSVNSDNSITKTGKKLLSLIGSTETKLVTLNDLKTNDDFDYTEYLFNKWDIYYDIDGNPIYMTNPKFNEFSGTVTSLLDNRVIFVTDDSGNVRAFQLPDIPIIFNGALGNFKSLSNSRIKVVYEDNSYNGKVIGVIAYKATSEALISRKDLYVYGNRTFAGKYLPLLSSDVNYNKIHVYGDATSLDEIKESDLVYFYETDETNFKKTSIYIEVIRSQVQGIVTNAVVKNNDVYYTVNNNTYKTAGNYIHTENASIKDKVKFILDKNNDIYKLYITSYGKLPTTYGIVLNSTSGTNMLGTAKLLDQYGNIKTYSLAGNSSVTTYVDYGSYEQYLTSLRKDNIVKFDPVSQGAIKIINYLPSIYISTYYNEATQYIGNTYKVSSNTFIVYKNGTNYQLIKPTQLDGYLVGNAYVDSSGHVDVLLLSSGLKQVKTAVENTVETPNATTEIKGFSGTIYDMIKSYAKVNDSTIQVQFFNTSGIYYVSSTSAAGKKVPSLLNAFIKTSIYDGNISSIERVTPETDKIRISSVYSNQLKIDNITYMEYSSNVKVYVCTLDSKGYVSSMRSGSKNDLQSGSKAQLYDIYGSFDGIIDVIIVFK